MKQVVIFPARQNCERRISSVIALSMMAFLFQFNPASRNSAFAETDDRPAWLAPPSACKGSHGAFHFYALGRTVIKIPFGAEEIREDEILNKIAPPDPGQPAGCYDNPRQYPSMYLPVSLDRDYVPFTQRIEQIPLHIGTLSEAPNTYPARGYAMATPYGFTGFGFPNPDQHVLTALKICNSPQALKRRYNLGLIGCIKAPGSHEFNRLNELELPGVYYSDDSIDIGFDGVRLVSVCGDASSLHLGISSGQCDVHYQASAAVLVDYRYNNVCKTRSVNGGVSCIPPDRFIEFNRRFRALLRAWTVGSYQWPKSNK